MFRGAERGRCTLTFLDTAGICADRGDINQQHFTRDVFGDALCLEKQLTPEDGSRQLTD